KPIPPPSPGAQIPPAGHTAACAHPAAPLPSRPSDVSPPRAAPHSAARGRSCRRSPRCRSPWVPPTPDLLPARETFRPSRFRSFSRSLLLVYGEPQPSSTTFTRRSGPESKTAIEIRPMAAAENRCLVCANCRLNFRFVDIEVGVDVLHVIVFFQCFHQPQHLRSLLPGKLDVVLRHHAQLGRSGLNPGLHQRFFHRLQRFRRRHDVPRRPLVLHIFGACFQN